MRSVSNLHVQAPRRLMHKGGCGGRCCAGSAVAHPTGWFSARIQCRLHVNRIQGPNLTTACAAVRMPSAAWMLGQAEKCPTWRQPSAPARPGRRSSARCWLQPNRDMCRSERWPRNPAHEFRRQGLISRQCRDRTSRLCKWYGKLHTTCVQSPRHAFREPSHQNTTAARDRDVSTTLRETGSTWNARR